MPNKMINNITKIQMFILIINNKIIITINIVLNISRFQFNCFKKKYKKIIKKIIKYSLYFFYVINHFHFNHLQKNILKI